MYYFKKHSKCVLVWFAICDIDGYGFHVDLNNTFSTNVTLVFPYDLICVTYKLL